MNFLVGLISESSVVSVSFSVHQIRPKFQQVYLKHAQTQWEFRALYKPQHYHRSAMVGVIDVEYGEDPLTELVSRFDYLLLDGDVVPALSQGVEINTPLVRPLQTNDLIDLYIPGYSIVKIRLHRNPDGSPVFQLCGFAQADIRVALSN